MQNFTASDLRLRFNEICEAIENGEEVIIEKRGQPYAKLTLLKNERKESKAGSFKYMLLKDIPEGEHFHHPTKEDEWGNS